jgi:hypothetical protein
MITWVVGFLVISLRAVQEVPDVVTGEPADVESSAFWDAENQCAAWAVFAACRASGLTVEEKAIGSILPADGKPKSLLQVRNAFDAVGIRSSGAHFHKRRFEGPPRIMVIPLRPKGGGLNHFYAVLDWTHTFVLVCGDGQNTKWIEQSDLAAHWDGYAIVLEKQPRIGAWLLEQTIFSLFLSLCCAAFGTTVLYFKRAIILRLRSELGLLFAISLVSLGASGCDRSEPSTSQLVVLPSELLVVEGEERPSFNDGENFYPAGYYAIAEFTLKNTTNNLIRIESVRTDCQCAEVPLTQQWIAPGAGGPLSVQVGTQQPNPRKIRVTVTYTDPQTRNLVLFVRLHPKINPPQIVDTELKLKLVTKKGRATFFVRTIEQRDTAPWLAGALFSSDDIRTTSIELIGREEFDDVEQRMYEVTIEAALSGGTYWRTIELIDCEDGVIGEINEVQVIVPELIAIEPNLITATVTLQQSATLRRRVAFRISEESARSGFSPSIVSKQPEWLDLHLETGLTDSSILPALALQLFPDMVPEGNHQCVVELQTGIDDCPSLFIPVALNKVDRLHTGH